MTAALIIAAGRRSGREDFAPGAKFGAISAIERVALLFQRSGVPNILVCGQEDEVKKLVPSMNLVFLPCPDGEMLDCIKAGLSFLQGRCREVLVCHVDVPLFSVSTVRTLLAAEGAVCVPAHAGTRGHPILLREAIFPEILAYQGGQGLKGAIEKSSYSRTIVEVDDPGILPDIQNAAQYDTLLQTHDIGKLRLGCQFRIGRECVFYGPGVHQLLLLTEELGSLSDACRYMGISYSKGRKIIATMEQQLGCAVLESRQGGRGGGSSRLTEPSRDMTARYAAFCQEAEDLLQGLFQKHFPE